MTAPPRSRFRWLPHLGATPAGDVLLLTATWIGLVALAWPVGEFPLNDDWLYALSARSLRNDGVLWIRDWAAAPAVAQVLWGTLFTLPFGFSFAALRLSTLVLGLGGVLGTYGLILRVAARPTARLGAVALAVHPLYFSLACTFMTDVPFAACAVLALLAFARGLDEGTPRFVLLATALAVAATLIRQIGLALPLGFGVAFLMHHGPGRRQWLTAMAPTAVVLGALLAVQAGLEATTGLPAQYEIRAGYIADFFLHPNGAQLHGAAARWTVLGLYVGLFSLPLVVCLRPTGPHPRRAARFGAGAAGLIVAGALVWKTARLPLAPNLLHAAGLGPPTLRDAYLEGALPLAVVPPWLWLILTAGAVVGVAGLVFAALDLLGPGRRWPLAVLTAATLAALAFPLGLGPLFDRYAVALAPAALVLLAGAPAGGRAVRRAGWLIVVAFGVFSVTATHDYFAWNRARWRAIETLATARGVDPEQIDGGYEYNGWRFYDRDHAAHPGGAWRWGARDDAYVVGFGPMQGYEITAEFAYTRWLPPGTDHILVLHRRATPGAAR